MILEGLITTMDAAGRMHVAAMGPEIDEREVLSGTVKQLILKPFDTSQTAANLATHPAGVFHLCDDVLLLAKIVAGSQALPPACRPAATVQGWILDNACRSYEFLIEQADTSGQRARLVGRVVASHESRPFVGFSRAKHAVVEGAILISRLHLLGAEEVRRRLQDLAVLVEKTGGTQEHQAFQILQSRVETGVDRATQPQQQ